MRRAILTGAVVGGVGAGACCMGAWGQSLNVDFGSMAGVPSDSYAGAGLAGRWNVIDVVPAGPVLLVGLEGQKTTAGIFVGHGGEAVSMDDPATKGEEERLMDDFMPGLGDQVRFLMFAGLENGLYRIFTYGWTPTAPSDTTAVWVEEHGGAYQVCGGEWPGGLELGITHARHHANVVKGELIMSTAGGHFGASGNVNAIQLVRLGEVCLADWTHDGIVNSQDFFDFLSAFFAGFADFNADGVTDSRDFFAFLPEFFAGCP